MDVKLGNDVLNYCINHKFEFFGDIHCTNGDITFDMVRKMRYLIIGVSFSTLENEFRFFANVYGNSHLSSNELNIYLDDLKMANTIISHLEQMKGKYYGKL